MNLKSDLAALQMTITSMANRRREIGRHCERATQILFYDIAGRSDGKHPTPISAKELDDLSSAVNGIMSVLNWKEGE